MHEPEIAAHAWARMELLSNTRSRIFVRNLAAGELLELFFVAAVSAVLLIRFWLGLTGYPKLGGAGLHIAHMLWGGLLMLVALVLVLVYLGLRVLRLAAVVAGAGFGTFIDELGKFITSDNNYFYRPTMALIYLTFVSLFLLLRGIQRQRAWTEETYVINVLVLLQEAVLHDLDAPEHSRAMALLRQVSNERDSLAAPLRQLFEAISPVRARGPSRRDVLLQRGRQTIRRVLASPWLPRALAACFALRALTFVVAAVTEAVRFAALHQSISGFDFATFGAALLANTLAVLGLVGLLGSRFRALRWFRRSIVVSILLVDVLAFYQQELLAISGLTVDLVLFAIVNALLRRERAHTVVQSAEARVLAQAEGAESKTTAVP